MSLMRFIRFLHQLIKSTLFLMLRSYEIVNAKYSRLQSENNQSPSNESFNKHNELYKNYKQRQMKILQLTEQVHSEYNFIPETNNNYKIDQDFITRQETHKRKLQEKLKE